MYEKTNAWKSTEYLGNSKKICLARISHKSGRREAWKVVARSEGPHTEEFEFYPEGMGKRGEIF